MSVNKLFIFAKNTDAFNSLRGYNYQTLKTLETWVYNFLNNNNDDEIYCEFEEDIFQKDTLGKEIKFRQIKLYSSNFSFSSVEIKKCISHFFMLHVKSDYTDFSKEYIFETNSNIAKKYLDNDADLLREWFEHQHNLNDEQLSSCASKVKEIVCEYINEQKASLNKDTEVSEAIDIFNGLDEQFWVDFVKMIKWKFASTSPEEEFALTKSNIDDLIAQLPYNYVNGNPELAFGVLLDKVFEKVNRTDEHHRKLTYDQLEQAILSIGDDKDKWYSQRYDYYKSLPMVDEFRIGEFYEIIDLANYCRRKKYLHQHKNTWNPILIYYARNESIGSVFRRKAIYELIFVNNGFYELDYDNLSERIRPDGSLSGFEEDIRYYFSNISTLKLSEDLEKAKILLTLICTAKKINPIDISEEELKAWLIIIYRKINQGLLRSSDVNERCSLLEQKGTFLLSVNRVREKEPTNFVNYFYEVLELAESAPLFKLSQFGDRIEKYIKMQINVDPEDDIGIINCLEEFSTKLFPLVEKREGKVRLAQSQVQRGYSFLNTTVPKNLLRALDYFHKAKDNYLQEDTIEGYVLGLLNIAQLYNSIGMHFAAKNYALAAFRVSSNKELIKRIEQSLSILAYSDFRQGCWFNSLTAYSRYISIRMGGNFDISEFERSDKTTLNTGFILYVMRRSSNQFTYFIDSYLKYLGYVGEEIITPMFEKMDQEILSDENYKRIIQNQIDDSPFNDVGKERFVKFYALGSLWTIRFSNTHDLSSVAEEYISSIQIVLAEIALSDVDFHLMKSSIEIELVLSDNYLPPEQIPSNELLKWKVYICKTDEVGPENITKHSVLNLVSLRYILDDISLLKSEEFETEFRKFFKSSKLDSKHVVVNLYQKIHRDLYYKDDFDAFQSPLFNMEDVGLTFPIENIVMTWDNSLSKKYDKNFNIDAIKNRFHNAYQSTYLTVAEIKEDPGFDKWLDDLRNKGWKDWQILMNMQNFMINYKIRRLEEFKFDTEAGYVEALQNAFFKYVNMDEKDCYIQFPLDAFKTKEFTDQFDISLSSLLQTYGLEMKLKTPNFNAIKEFLNTRFNLQVDDDVEKSPF